MTDENGIERAVLLAEIERLHGENVGLKIGCGILHAKIKQLADEIDRLKSAGDSRLNPLYHEWLDDLLGQGLR